MSTSWDRGFMILEAAILDFSLSVESYNIPGSFIGQVDPKNDNLVFEILFLCCLRAEIYVSKLKFLPGVRHLEFLLPIRPYSNPNESFGFSFRRPYRRCTTCYFIQCLRHKSKGVVTNLPGHQRRKIGLVIVGLILTVIQLPVSFVDAELVAILLRIFFLHPMLWVKRKYLEIWPVWKSDIQKSGAFGFVYRR